MVYFSNDSGLLKVFFTPDRPQCITIEDKPVTGSQLLGGGTAEKFSEGDVFVLKK